MATPTPVEQVLARANVTPQQYQNVVTNMNPVQRERIEVGSERITTAVLAAFQNPIVLTTISQQIRASNGVLTPEIAAIMTAFIEEYQLWSIFV